MLSACTIGLWGTLTFTEFDCTALLATCYGKTVRGAGWSYGVLVTGTKALGLRSLSARVIVLASLQFPLKIKLMGSEELITAQPVRNTGGT